MTWMDGWHEWMGGMLRMGGMGGMGWEGWMGRMHGWTPKPFPKILESRGRGSPRGRGHQAEARPYPSFYFRILIKARGGAPYIHGF